MGGSPLGDGMSTDDGRATRESGDPVERAAERLGGLHGTGAGGHGGPVEETTATGGSTPPERAGRADRLEQLLVHQATAGDRPYLERVPSGYAAESVVFDWLGFLVEQAGYRETVDALRYYRSVGWLTERAEDQLTEYLRGFPDPPAGESLDVDDHQQSLVYVAQLASLE